MALLNSPILDEEHERIMELIKSNLLDKLKDQKLVFFDEEYVAHRLKSVLEGYYPNLIITVDVDKSKPHMLDVTIGEKE